MSPQLEMTKRLTEKTDVKNANGFMNLTKDSSIIVFSDKTLEESLDDDIRYPYDKWDIWKIEHF